jgi:hypothetical protein
VISLLVLVEAVALLVTLRWLLVGVRAAAAAPPAVQALGSVAVPPPVPRSVAHAAVPVAAA